MKCGECKVIKRHGEIYGWCFIVKQTMQVQPHSEICPLDNMIQQRDALNAKESGDEQAQA